MNKSLACLLVAGVSSLALARTNTVVNGISDWKSQSSYLDQSFVPGAGDVVILPALSVVYVNSKEQNDFISQFERIWPESETSRIVFNVPENETWDLLCAITKANLPKAGGSDFVNGEVVKRGAGTLLMGGGNKLVIDWYTGYDCWTGVTVEEGRVKLNPIAQDKGTGEMATPNLYLGYLTVSNNATFEMGGSMCIVRGLFGEGLVTNATVSANKVLQNIGAKGQRHSVFSGRFAGLFNYLQNGLAGITFLGTNNVFQVPSSPGENNASGMRAGSGEIALAAFGNKNKASSAGPYPIMYYTTNGNDPQFTYVGEEGETTDKTFYVPQHATYTAALSGGHHGGVTFTGEFTLGTSADRWARNFIFTGSNAVECVMDGRMYGCYSSSSTTYDCLYYRKEGSGAWRFTQHYGRTFPSGFAIREGALRFDSLHERGQLSSLGLATNLTDGTGYAYVPQVSYAYQLGTTEAGKADAVFEYTGTNSVQCSTRPIVLAGDGHLRNNTARRFRFAGVSSLAAGRDVKTLVLDGTGLNTNEVADVSDGAGKTGVTKEGAGTWALSGDQTFTGPLRVNEGTLIVRKTLPGKYTWFRWTMKDKQPDANGNYSTRLNVCSFALFDKDGKFQSTGLAENGHYAELEPGEFGFQTDYRYECFHQTVTLWGEPYRLFRKENDYGFNATFYPPKSTTATTQRSGKPDTWVPIVMRLPETANEVASFDYMNTWGNSSVNVIGSSLEGSVDGLHWNMLTNNLVTSPTAESWRWDISDTKGYTEPHTGGAAVTGATDKVYHLLEDVESVSVAAGAKLVAEGDVTISDLVVDAAGAGTFDGFTFDTTGTIAFTNVPRGTVTIPASFVNVKGGSLANLAQWDFTINGLDKNYAVTVTEDGFKLTPPGLLMIFR